MSGMCFKFVQKEKKRGQQGKKREREEQGVCVCVCIQGVCGVCVCARVCARVCVPVCMIKIERTQVLFLDFLILFHQFLLFSITMI